MTTLSTNIIPGVSVGILHPALCHQFRIRYGMLRECTNEAANILSMQSQSLEFDLVNDTYILKIQQPIIANSEFVDVLRSMCQNGFKIKAELLDGAETVVSIILESNVWVEKHHAVLDYARSETVVHTLTLKLGHRPFGTAHQ